MKQPRENTTNKYFQLDNDVVVMLDYLTEIKGVKQYAVVQDAVRSLYINVMNGGKFKNNPVEFEKYKKRLRGD